ncbi:MAG TPA: DUF1127 domain-containing protein [Microvirga sp.]|jgi:uncharacterized protein YjiS (DUF1127 family)|nr:DUF1127 domain-containing protein [Microvirga sp.]
MTRSVAPHLSATRPSLAVRAGRGLLRFAADLAKALRDRREVKRLTELDDRALHDIGLTRSDVDGALSSPLLRSPSLVLVEAAERRGRVQSAYAPGRMAGRAERPVVATVERACCA